MPRTTLPTMLLAVAALSVPSVAPAQSWIHSWTLCTPSASFHSCHSVSIQTDAILDNTNARTGTTISIALHNLQGQGYAADNTTSSGLLQVLMVGPNLGFSPPCFINTSVPGVPSGGATGTPAWKGCVASFFDYNRWVTRGYTNLTAFDYSTNQRSLIGGCGSDALPYAYGGHTCAPNSAFTFSFTIGVAADANEFAATFISAYGVRDHDFCMSDPSQYPPFAYPACDVQSESLTQVTPEPVTVALLGTGLFGIAGARLRRKKKDSSIDA